MGEKADEAAAEHSTVWRDGAHTRVEKELHHAASPPRPPRGRGEDRWGLGG